MASRLGAVRGSVTPDTLGLLQAFGSLLVGPWGLAGSRGPQPRLALVSLASLVR